LRPYQMLAAKISPMMTTTEIKLFFLMIRLPYLAAPIKCIWIKWSLLVAHFLNKDRLTYCLYLHRFTECGAFVCNLLAISLGSLYK
jgi:hypothetical protein